MSDIPQDFTANVTNWKGSRSIASSVEEIMSEAAAVASEVINKVDSALDKLEASGNKALADAIKALEALGAFSPHAIAVNYSPPEFLNPDWLRPGGFSLAVPSGATTTPSLGSVTLGLYTPTAPTVGGTPPIIEDVTFGDVPQMQTFFAPPAPALGGLKSIGDPPPMSFKEFTATMPVPPALRELVLPTFVPQPFPEYVPPPSVALPPPPGGEIDVDLDGLVDYVRIWGDEIVTAAPELGGVLVRDLVTERDVRNSYETWRIRGWQLDEPLLYAQIDNAYELTRLMNQAESRQLIIDEGLLGSERERILLGFMVKYSAMMIELAIAVGKVHFEALVAQAEMQLALAKALTAYYNALIAQYGSDADLYKLSIEEEVAKMKYWEALVQAEVAKTKANEQMARLYVETEQVETIEAEVYQAQVGTVLAQAERYRAQIEAIVAKSEVAKTALLVYRGETDAYAAGVAAYKAHFDAYAAQMKSVSAQNQAQQSASEVSLAGAQQVAAQAQLISTNIEVASEQLKAQATKISSTYENAKLHNAVEANKAQIASSLARVHSLIYSTDKQVNEIQNEAASAFAQAAARYYNQASDAAYRASEQTLKAITAATQAAAIAQEAAGKTSAAMSQGALSAVHVSAGLQGSGRTTGGEQEYANMDQRISDMLTYSETKSESIGA